MEMKHGLSMQQKPTLIMTQRLQQALKLLQMPTLELQQALKLELERNPLLEEVDEIEEVQEIEDVKKEEGQDGEAEPVETAEPDKNQEVDWNELWPDNYEIPSAPRTDDPDAEFYERVPVTRRSLGDHLIDQLRLLERGEEDLAIGEYLIGSIDENGYLQTTVEEVAEQFAVAPDKPGVAYALAIEELEPVLAGDLSRARDTGDCLV